ncbi:hypothetical protein [Emcibacter sp.]|uniref:hypothetical protein n=1 Tax=Emcibacter sp. TaxID=1979954 RepID=UPI003A9193C0
MSFVRIFFCSFLSCLIVATTSLQAVASTDDLYQRSGMVGVYFKIPLGETNPDKAGPRYGLRLSMENSYARQSLWEDPAVQFNPQLARIQADLLSLNFNEAGFNNLTLAGQPSLTYRNGTLYAGGGVDKPAPGEEKKEKETSYIGLGLVIVGGTLLLLTAAFAVKAATDDCFMNYFSDEC